MIDLQFYPTPPMLASKMLRKVTWRHYSRVLDPSAGQGDLIDAAIKRHDMYRVQYAAIEVDSTRQAVLRGKGIDVIDSDFLQYSGQFQPELIIMNPPFNDGDSHLLKAIQIMYSGEIICLLNAETLRNPYTNQRKELVQKLTDLNADIEYLGQAFKDVNAEIAMVHIKIENFIDNEELFSGIKKEQKRKQEPTFEYDNSLVTNDKINAMVATYQETIKASTQLLIDFYKKKSLISGYITIKLGRQESSNNGDNTGDFRTDVSSIEAEIKKEVWLRVLKLSEVSRRLTNKQQQTFRSMLNDWACMEFSENNIHQLIQNIIANFPKTMEEGAEDLFDTITGFAYANHEHLNTKNIHYYNGWKTNNCFKLTKKFIYAFREGAFRGWHGEWALRHGCHAKETLEDIEKIVRYLDGDNQHGTTLVESMDIYLKQGVTSHICEYFEWKVHKKGTCHLTFLDENILRRWNVLVGRKKGWLPFDYGTKPASDMSTKEIEVAKSFENGGIKDYEVLEPPKNSVPLRLN